MGVTDEIVEKDKGSRGCLFVGDLQGGMEVCSTMGCVSSGIGASLARSPRMLVPVLHRMRVISVSPGEGEERRGQPDLTAAPERCLSGTERSLGGVQHVSGLCARVRVRV